MRVPKQRINLDQLIAIAQKIGREGGAQILEDLKEAEKAIKDVDDANHRLRLERVDKMMQEGAEKLKLENERREQAEKVIKDRNKAIEAKKQAAKELLRAKKEERRIYDAMQQEIFLELENEDKKRDFEYQYAQLEQQRKEEEENMLQTLRDNELISALEEIKDEDPNISRYGRTEPKQIKPKKQTVRMGEDPSFFRFQRQEDISGVGGFSEISPEDIDGEYRGRRLERVAAQKDLELMEQHEQATLEDLKSLAMESDLAEKSAKIKNLETDLQKAQGETETVKKSIEILKEGIKKQNQIDEASKKDAEEEETRLELERNQEKQELLKKNKDHLEAIAGLQKSTSEQQRTITTLQATINQNEIMINQKPKEIEKKVFLKDETKEKELEEENQKLQETITDLQKSKTDQETTITTLQATIKDNVIKINQIPQEIEKPIFYKDKAKEEELMNKLEEQLKKQKEVEDKLKIMTEAYNTENQNFTKFYADMRKIDDTYKATYDSAIEDVHNKNNQTMGSLKGEAERIIKLWQTREITLKQENETLQSQLTSATNEAVSAASTAAAEKKQLTEQYEKAEEKYKATISSKEKTEQELRAQISTLFSAEKVRQEKEALKQELKAEYEDLLLTKEQDIANWETWRVTKHAELNAYLKNIDTSIKRGDIEKETAFNTALVKKTEEWAEFFVKQDDHSNQTILNIAKTDSQIKALTGEITSLKSQLESKTKLITELKSLLKKEQKKTEEQRQLVIAANENLSKSEAKVTLLELEVSTLKLECEAAKKSSKLEIEKAKRQKEYYDKLNQEFTALQTEMQKKNDVETTAEEYQTKLNSMEEDKEKMLRQYTQQARQIRQLKEKVTALRTEIKDKDSSLQAKDIELTSLRGKLATCQADLKTCSQTPPPLPTRDYLFQPRTTTVTPPPLPTRDYPFQQRTKTAAPPPLPTRDYLFRPRTTTATPPPLPTRDYPFQQRTKTATPPPLPTRDYLFQPRTTTAAPKAKRTYQLYDDDDEKTRRARQRSKCTTSGKKQGVITNKGGCMALNSLRNLY